MILKPCKPYHARTVAQSILHMPDGKSVFKVYYISIIGRDTPEIYEWQYSPLTIPQFEQSFLGKGYQGLGFVTAFPHVTKIFRFSPYMETILDLTEFLTPEMRPRDSSRGDDSREFACYAEAVIAAEEYHAWARAQSVPEYLAFRCSASDFPVVDHAKLANYWQQG